MSIETPLRLLAFADLHGRWYKESAALIRQEAPDWIVLLGDMLPDFELVHGFINCLGCQRDHWKVYGPDFNHGQATTTFVRGNHELEGFQVPSEQRRIPGLLAGQVLRLEGIPSEFGRWGWSREWSEPKLAQELENQLRNTPRPAIILSHVPPFGVLDSTPSGEHIGHRPLARFLQAKAGKKVSLVLCGHVHQARGSMRVGDTLVVNVSEGFALLDSDGSTWNLLRIESMSEYASQLRITSGEDA